MRWSKPSRSRTTSGRHGAQAELDVLVAELARSLGLDGRARTAASVSERARLNVTRALRSALAKLTEALPVAGAVLDRRVRTAPPGRHSRQGVFCAYEPHADDEAMWSVQSRLNEPGPD